MSLSAGTRLGPYEILSPLGAGGMGEVYKARDTRLGRDVAVKVLPSHLSDSPDLKARFEREARSVAALSHPHICAIHDVGSQDGIDYLVMELLEGQTLADRLDKGALATDQVLKFGIEIAGALDKAHHAGIVHRDLKPGNIMLTKSGVKLLDFGLAKLQASAAAREISQLSSLPTELSPSQPLTEKGTVLGTFQYMAPEQLEGKDADARTDIFSFGCVLYEMATGKKAFTGKSRASMIAAILEHDPEPISSIAPMTPPGLDRVVKTCLAKEPEDRFETAHDVRLQLEWIAEAGSQAGVAAPVVASRRRRDRLSWAIAGALAGAVLAAAAVWMAAQRSAAASRKVTRVAVAMPAGDSLVLDHYSSLAISPDGRQVVYVGRRTDKRQLFVRALDSDTASPIAGTEGAFSPFFSPDGQMVGFWADGKIKKIALSGGAPVTICEIGGESLLGAAWGHDDTIVFPKEWGKELQRAAASGGAPRPLTKVSAKGENRGHLWPEFLPGGKAVLFTIFTGGSLEDFQIAAVSLSTGEQKVLVKGGTFGRYAASGHLLYVRGGTLFAVPFDPGRLEVTGAAFPVVDGVFENTNGGAGYAVSRDGTLVYASGGLQLTDRSLFWVDRQGKETSASKLRRSFAGPAVSPDGRRVALVVQAETYDIWVLDFERDSLTRLSFGKDDGNPVWSPDGKRVVYDSSQAGAYNLYSRAADGSGSEQRLTTDPDGAYPRSFSPDGNRLLFDKFRAGSSEIWVYPFEKGSSPRPFLQGQFRYGGGWLSPDGRWLAYTSNESGKSEVYVTAFPGPGGKWQISTDGGESALWGPTGREMFYGLGKKIMRVAVTTTPAFSASRPELLFEGEYQGWSMAPDAKRFLMVKDDAAASSPRDLNLVLNWFEDLKQRATGAGNR